MYGSEIIALLRKARRDQGLTQDELAERIGVSLDTLRRWERRQRDPKFSDVVAWAEELGVEITVRDTPDVRTQ